MPEKAILMESTFRIRIRRSSPVAGCILVQSARTGSKAVCVGWCKLAQRDK